jgi:hypothetical protein
MTVKANRMAHTINERAGVYDKLKGQMDKTNRQRIEILQTLTQKLEGIKQYGIETDTLRNISPGELALKLRNTAGLTVAQARETSTRMLREYKTYLEDFQEAGKLSDTFQGLRTQVDDIGTELTDLKDQYNDMLVNVYKRITSNDVPVRTTPASTVRRTEESLEKVRNRLLDDSPRSASDVMSEGEDFMVSQSRAMAEIERHGAKFADFAKEIGLKAKYTGAEVLKWLGY